MYFQYLPSVSRNKYRTVPCFSAHKIVQKFFLVIDAEYYVIPLKIPRSIMVEIETEQCRICIEISTFPIVIRDNLANLEHFTLGTFGEGH